MFLCGVKCDTCGEVLWWGVHYAKKWLIKWVRQEGWAVSNKKITCPKCRKSGK